MVRIAGALLDIDNETSKTPCETACNNSYDVSQKVIDAVNDCLLGNPRSISNDSQLIGKLALNNGLPNDHIRCFGSPVSAIENIARTFLEHGTDTVVSSTGNRAFMTAAQGTGSIVNVVEHDDPFSHRIESVIANIGPRTRMVYIENPDKITGFEFSESEMVFLLAYAESAMIVIDESYIHHSGSGMAELIKRFHNLIIIRSISAVHGMGPFSMSYILSDPQNLEYIDRITSEDPNTRLIYAAAEAALSDPDCLQRNLSSIEKSRKMLTHHLPQLGYQFHISNAEFMLLRAADTDFGIRLFNDSGFVAEDLSHIEGFNGFIRVAIGSPRMTETILMELSLASGHLATGFNRNRLEISAQPQVNERIRTEILAGVSKR